MFLQNTPKNWAQQVHMYVFRLISQPVSALNVLPQELVSHTRPQFPLTIDLNLNLNIINACISQYCFPLPENSHYDKTDLNQVFYKTLSKPLPRVFLAFETAMLQLYSIVHDYSLRKISSQAYITKTYHESKPLPLGTFVLNRNLNHVHYAFLSSQILLIKTPQKPSNTLIVTLLHLILTLHRRKTNFLKPLIQLIQILL